jgi:hypothetical protein
MPFDVTTLADPRGCCGSCAYFIDDRQEVGDELAGIARKRPTMTTTERVKVGSFKTHNSDGTTEMMPIYKAAEVKRTVYTVDGLALAIHQRWPFVDPFDVGLCELGVADLVTRDAGSRPQDRCPRWKEKQALRKRPDNWRELRDIVADLGTGLTLVEDK